MAILTLATQPFSDQRPGSTGLRKPVRQVQQPHYLQNFIQALFDVLPSPLGQTLVLGGDGRFFNDAALQILVRMAAAHGFARVLVGRGGLLSSAAASAVIRHHDAMGAIVLSAHHHPGGPQGDFGFTFHTRQGGPAPEALNEAVYQRSLQVQHYRLLDTPDLDFSRLGRVALYGTAVVVIDPVADYVELMQQQFDFPLLRRLFAGGFRLRFDAMHGVSGPYARAILEDELGAPRGTVLRAAPLPDFGGQPPDPSPAQCAELLQGMQGAQALDFAAACDGAAERLMVMGVGSVLTASDGLALLAAHAARIPAFAQGMVGVARTLPTSTALDAVARQLGIPCYETPVAWRHCGHLLGAGRVSLCGDASAALGGPHARAKDAVWALLLWLQVLAATGASVAQLLRAHWAQFGRHYHCRQDYAGLPEAQAQALVQSLRERLPAMRGLRLGARRVVLADDFSYTDPVDGQLSAHQGLRLVLEDGARMVWLLCGTDTAGATLRLYLEQPELNPQRHGLATAAVLAPLALMAERLACVRTRTGRLAPSLIA